MIIESSLTLFFMLVFGHVLADYPLQGDFLAKAKNRFDPIPGVPWYQGMFAHAAIHAGFVGIITGTLYFALMEFIVHSIIDDSKCAKQLSYNEDQFLHILCKVIYTALIVSLTP